MIVDKYYCSRCNSVYTEDELEIHEWYESRGEFWGAPCSERMSEAWCPKCKTDEYLDIYNEDEEEEII